MNRALALLGKVTHLGVDPALPRHATKHIVLANQYALFVAFCMIGSAVGPAAPTLLPVVRSSLLVGGFGTLLVPMFNRLRRHVLASAWLIAVNLVVFGIGGRLEPAATEHAVSFIVTAAIGWFVFPPGQRIGPAVATLASAAGLVWLTWSLRHFPPTPQMPGFDVNLIGLGNLAIFFVVLVFFCVRTAAEMTRVERELVAERAKSEALLKREVAHQVAERSREMGAALTRSDGPLAPSALASSAPFGSRYRVVRPLGEGAMGAVFEVERLSDAQHLALKVMTSSVSREHAARFAREAEIGARVHDPNVVSIVDVGIAEGGAPFLVMELVTGGSLDGQRKRFGDAAWAQPILRDVLRGLVALHDAGVVHRDLKPANVLLDESGRAKVSDFGIARFGPVVTGAIDAEGPTLGASTPKSHDLTGTGAWVGTPFYMAPEAGRGGRDVGPAADVFSFGILAYELLTGRAPFSTPPVVLAMAGEPLPTPAPLDVDVLDAAARDAIRACLEEDPTTRPDTRKLVLLFSSRQ